MSDYGTIDLSGTLVTASGVAACRPRALTVYGRSTQDGTPTPSAPVAIESVTPNLYQQTRQAVGTTYTVSGLTFTYDSTNSATVSGTSTANAVAAWPDNVADDTLFVHVPAGTYTATSSHNVEVKKRVGTTLTTLVAYSTQRFATFTLAEDTDILVVPVLIGSGVNFTGTRVWACLFAGSVPSVGVPYGHAGLWARGKNLLRTTADTQTISGVTFTRNEDGTFRASGTATGTVQLFLVPNNVAFLTLKAGTYTLSGCPAGGGISTYKLDLSYSDGSALVDFIDFGSTKTFTLAEDTTFIRARIVVYPNTNVDNLTFSPMLERGSTATAYQPYESTVTPIPLDGHELRSLPDGTRDEVTVDERGHAVLVQRVGAVDPSTLAWGIIGTGSNVRFRCLYPTLRGNARVLCTKLVSAPSYDDVFSHRVNNSIVGHPTAAQFEAYASAYADASAFKTALADATLLYPLAIPVTIDLGTIDPVPLVGPDLTAQTVPSTEFALTALLKTGRTAVMWDGEELGAGWTFVSDRREQLLPTDVATIDVPGRDGALFGGVTRAVRQVTLALHVMGPFGERAPHVRELAARLAVDGPRPLMFSDEAPLYRMAVPNADPEGVAFYNADGYADVKFVCPDPWFYGEEAGVTVPSGGSVTFTVGGTAPTMPIVTAPAALNGSGGVWRLMLDDTTYIAASVPSARSLVCDCVDRVLRVNGAVTLLRPDADWLVLEPGTHTLAMTGTGAATVKWTERWY